MIAQLSRVGILSQDLDDEMEPLIPNDEELLQLLEDEESIRTLYDPVYDAEPIDERQPVDQLDAFLAGETLEDEFEGPSLFPEERPAKKRCYCKKDWGRTLAGMR